MARRDSRLEAPRISAPDLPRRLDPTGLTPREEIFGGSIEGVRGDVDGVGSRIVESAIRSMDAGMLALTGAALTDVEVTDLRAVEAQCRESRWQTVSVAGGRVGTLDLSRAELTGVELRGIRIDYLTLAGAKVSDVLFADCTIGSLDAPQATLSRVAFTGCRVDEVDNRDWRIEHVDLRGLEALHFLDMSALRGATLSDRQVTALARDFAVAAGVDVRD